MKWISVKDRLPALYTYVLCAVIPEKRKSSSIIPPKLFLTAYCYDKNESAREYFKETGKEEGCFLGDARQYDHFEAGWNNGFEEITHWMPLPEIPE